MSKGLLAGLAGALAVCAVGVTDASACRRLNRGCGSYYAPPVAYQYGPPPGYAPGYPGYGYVPPAPVYGYGPPPRAYYAPYAPPPYAAPVYGYGAGPYGRGQYGYRGPRRCDRGYGYAPREVLYGDEEY
jgi:hypothetical protein